MAVEDSPTAAEQLARYDNDGWQVLQQLKAEPQTREIPVIIVSVVDQPERARALGAAAALLKPINRAGLEQTLRRVLTRQEDAFIQLAIVATPHRRTRSTSHGA